MHTPPHSSPQSNYSKKSPVSDAACQGGARMYKPEGMQQLHICCVVQQHDALNAWASLIQMGSSATAYATQVGCVSCDQQLATSIMQHDTTLFPKPLQFLKTGPPHPAWLSGAELSCPCQPCMPSSKLLLLQDAVLDLLTAAAQACWLA